MTYGITKGTDFEKLCEGAAKAEADVAFDCHLVNLALQEVSVKFLNYLKSS